MGLARTVNEQIFRHIHGKNLVYNTCWEDPRSDRQLLHLGPDSRVVMLTSAGCNALDYLLDDPVVVHCVDLNPRQNALLELKIALFQGADHAALFRFFGDGVAEDARTLFQNSLREHLPEGFSRNWWSRNLHVFSGRGMRRSFYWHGTSGTVAWMIRQWLHMQPEVLRLAERLFAAQNLAEQTIWYEKFEPKFLNPFLQWALQQHFLQSMLGVPKSQQALAADHFDDGMAGYFRHCLRQVFLELPLRDNYFWNLYFFGRYTPECCPNYLLPENFSTLKSHTTRLHTHTASLSDFLRNNPGAYTHFVLLDHQDWLAAHLRPALEEEWRLILENATPGARILMRSASFNLDFVPPFVHQRVRFDTEAAARMHRLDRVGTYASTWIGQIQ
ncbi:MAG: BtaA family protein [Saprospiraceae bacterium]|jgi:S-adenosylmethionine-diacylglycerol 3-amino-3-carboxypropyl transferase|nr:BtaA family protein [Saprospiraceae bacterium]